MRLAERFPRQAVQQFPGDGLPLREGDGVDQAVEPVPALAQRREAVRDLPVARDVAGQHEVGLEVARELGSKIALQCEVTSDAEIKSLFEQLGRQWDGLDGLVHAIAFAPRETIAGELLDGLSREAFAQAHDISAYSFPALAKAALPMMEGRKASLVTLTYLGSVRVVPHYNTMGLAKASLEAAVRYLAANLGPRGIRVNGISAGPIKTLAAAGISGFGKIQKFVEEHAPLRRNVTIDEVGNVAAFLLSDLASAVTGEILYVDSGFSQVVGGMAAATSSPDSPG